jgi:hypothetical protein
MRKNIISGIFMSVPQDQSRVTLQATLVQAILASTNKIASSLDNSIVVEALFINEI